MAAASELAAEQVACLLDGADAEVSLKHGLPQRTDSEHSGSSAGASGRASPRRLDSLAVAGLGSSDDSLTPSSSGVSEQEGSSAQHQGQQSLAGVRQAPAPTDARSSALKALAGISAVVSRSRKIDAEALQQIKSQRARAKAEGVVLGSARSSTPPPPGAETSASPFAASASAAPLTRAASLSDGPHMPLAGRLAPTASLPIHGTGRGPSTRGAFSPGAAPSPPGGRASAALPSSGMLASAFDEMVSKLTLGELLALKESVERQLNRQALSLAGLQNGAAGAAAAVPPPAPAAAAAPAVPDVLSAQYAAALLQAQHNAQAAQLVVAAQQLSSAQQQGQAVAHAAAIQQALAAAAAASGVGGGGAISPDATLMPPPATAPSLGPYSSLPLPIGAPSGNAMADPAMATPFATAAFASPSADGFSPPLSTLGSGPAGLASHASLGPGAGGGGGGGEGGSRASSPRTTSAEAHLIGDALHSMLDPTGAGRPSRQGSSALAWGDRAGSVGMPLALAGLPAGAGAAGGRLAASRSKSLPPPEGLFHDRSASLNSYLATNGSSLGAAAQAQLPALFGAAMRLQQQQPAAAGGAPPPAGLARQASLRGPSGPFSQLATIADPTWQ